MYQLHLLANSEVASMEEILIVESSVEFERKNPHVHFVLIFTFVFVFVFTFFDSQVS